MVSDGVSNWWLVKTEPSDYSIADLERDGVTAWDGVRNPVALRYLRAMAEGDRVLVYHSGARQRAVVGLARVVRAAYPDAVGGGTAVDVAFAGHLNRPVLLSQIKADPGLSAWELVRLPRLSVMPVPAEALDRIAILAGQGLSSDINDY